MFDGVFGFLGELITIITTILLLIDPNFQQDILLLEAFWFKSGKQTLGSKGVGPILSGNINSTTTCMEMFSAKRVVGFLFFTNSKDPWDWHIFTY